MVAKSKELPDKLYYSIGEVSGYTGIEPHTLRYWESEFKILVPKKNKAGKRTYTKNNIDNILYMKKLLYTDKYTIEGAKKKVRSLSHDKKLEELNEIEAKEVKPEVITEVVKEIVTEIKTEIVKEVDTEFFADIKEDLVLLKNYMERLI